jgi:hypothetical protein
MPADGTQRLRAMVGAVPEIVKTDFLASLRTKAPPQRRLDVELECQIDAFEEAARLIWNASGVKDAVSERLSLGETVAACAWRTAGLFATLSCSTDYRSQREIAAQMLDDLFDKGGALEASDGVARAAAMAELERIS